MTMELSPEAVMRQFAAAGKLLSIHPFGSGHINDTYCAIFNLDGAPARFILQRIHTGIFRNPVALMENIQRVTSHLSAQLAGDPESMRRVLTLIPAHDGRVWYQDMDGGCWRVYRFIEDAHTCDSVSTPQQAHQAARAFGSFQRMLADLPEPRLHDTIPDFHNTPKRFADFERALREDAAGRVRLAGPEIAFALAHRPTAGLLLHAGLPERVAHNDTKINNVMFDDKTGEGICVVDLDTVMPGLAPYDFGDMVRTATCTAGEDEPDLDKVAMAFAMFEALLRGYLSTAGDFLTFAEKQSLAHAGLVITFEQGIRFLADYLAGDTYYKVHREGQNLDRCRTQFKLIASMEAQSDAIAALVTGLTKP